MGYEIVSDGTPLGDAALAYSEFGIIAMARACRCPACPARRFPILPVHREMARAIYHAALVIR